MDILGLLFFLCYTRETLGKSDRLLLGKIKARGLLGTKKGMALLLAGNFLWAFKIASEEKTLRTILRGFLKGLFRPSN